MDIENAQRLRQALSTLVEYLLSQVFLVTEDEKSTTDDSLVERATTKKASEKLPTHEVSLQ